MSRTLFFINHQRVTIPKHGPLSKTDLTVRRIRWARGKRLLRWRGARLERPKAHLYTSRDAISATGAAPTIASLATLVDRRLNADDITMVLVRRSGA